MNTDMQLRITLTAPTSGVDFALQKGAGNTYEMVQKQNVSEGDISFLVPVTIKGERNTEALPKVSGPFVQGPSGGKFIYIDIGTYAGQIGTVWSRRLKVPLSGITWQLLDQLEAHPKLFLSTQVPGTGKDGGPNCATVKPFDGWQVIAG